MPYRIVFVVALTLILAGQAPVAGAIQTTTGETREYFRDWLAACRNDGGGYCSALATVPDPEGPGGIAARLRVAVPAPGVDPEIVFSPINRLVDINQPMTVRVDDNSKIVLPPGSGHARAGGFNDYGIVDGTMVAALIPQMKDGLSIAFDYMDEAGERARFTFSLMGLTAALRFIDGAQAQAGEIAPTTDPEQPKHEMKGLAGFSCRGNEPFWNLKIDGKTAEYSRLTGVEPARAIPLTGAMASLDFLRPALFVWRGRGDLASGDMVAMIARERCLDTMSDGEGQGAFDYTVRMSMPSGEILVGCCNAREGTAPAAIPAGLEDAPEADPDRKAPDDWSRLVLELLPAIHACLERTPGPVARLAKAWPMNHGMVGARTRDDGGRRWNCVAPGDGGTVNIFAPVPDGAEIVAGETRVVFTETSHAPPSGACFKHERVMNPETKTLIGWLSYDTC